MRSTFGRLACTERMIACNVIHSPEGGFGSWMSDDRTHMLAPEILRRVRLRMRRRASSGAGEP